MKVLKATLQQKIALEGIYLQGAELQFIQDTNECWVVNTDVINDDRFISIKDALESLPKIDFQPKINNI